MSHAVLLHHSLFQAKQILSETVVGRLNSSNRFFLSISGAYPLRRDCLLINSASINCAVEFQINAVAAQLLVLPHQRRRDLVVDYPNNRRTHSLRYDICGRHYETGVVVSGFTGGHEYLILKFHRSQLEKGSHLHN